MKKKGFTLIELLVVVAILGVLATVVLGALGDARNKAKLSLYQSQMSQIEKALQVTYLDENRSTWWLETDFSSGQNIANLLNVTSGPGASFSKNYPNIIPYSPFSGQSYFYDFDGDSNVACNTWHSGVNIFGSGYSNDQKIEADKFIDGDYSPNCGRITYNLTDGHLGYKISTDGKDFNFSR